MARENKIYRRLQKHLDQQVVGFPAAKNGADIRLLKHIFTREETLSIMDKNQKQGLVLQPSNTEKPEFICSCCGCCCGMLSIHQKLPKPLDFWVSNFQAQLDLNVCLGCGVCVPTCPQKTISLVKKRKVTRPPKDGRNFTAFSWKTVKEHWVRWHWRVSCSKIWCTPEEPGLSNNCHGQIKVIHHDLPKTKNECYPVHFFNPMYRVSTFFLAQGVFLRNLRLDCTEGSWLKHRMLMRPPISSQP